MTNVKLDIACANLALAMSKLVVSDEITNKWKEMANTSSVKRLMIKNRRDVIWEDITKGPGDVFTSRR